MTDLRQDAAVARERIAGPRPPERFYLAETDEADEINLLDLWRVVGRSKWLVLTLTFLGAFGAVVVALRMTPMYRAEVLLAPVAEQRDRGSVPSLALQFGGLADVVGIRLSGGDSTTEKAIAILESRTFTKKFIRDGNLLPMLFPERWDAESGEWVIPESSAYDEALARLGEMITRLKELIAGSSGGIAPGNPGAGSHVPSMRDAVEDFADARQVRSEKATGLVRLSIEWKDPQQAADWANRLIVRFNAHMRGKAIEEAEKNIRYLNGQVEKTTAADMRKLLYRLIENETKTIMLANGRDEFAFKVIDPAVVPITKSKPNLLQIAMFGFAGGLMLGVFLAFLRNFLRKRREEKPVSSRADTSS